MRSEGLCANIPRPLGHSSSPFISWSMLIYRRDDAYALALRHDAYTLLYPPLCIEMTEPAAAETRVLPEDAKPSTTATADHVSLKYSLLGPSLTKAGQESVDQTKVHIVSVTACSNF